MNNPNPKTLTIADFIAQTALTLTAERIDERPDQEDSDRNKGARHFACRIHSTSRNFPMRITFSQGSAFKEDPTLEDILQCLHSDFAGFDPSVPFEDWADDYGYDTDSRKAERIYNTIDKQRTDFLRFVGDASYTAFGRIDPDW